MASTYTLNNGIELIGTGEQSGTWGDTTNTNLSLLDTSLDGQVTVTLTAAGTSGSPNTLPISDGAASDGRNRMVIFNDGGDLGATAYVQLTPNDAEKIIYIRNDLSGSRSIILFQGTYNASNDYEVPAGTTAVIYFDGAGSGAVAANVFNNAYFDSLRLGSVSVTAILDEDDMSSDSATSLATQQSIKAYVDSQVTAQDLDFGGDSGTGAVDLDSQTFTIAGTANEIETSASGQTLTVGLPDNVTIAGDLTVDTDTLYVDSTNDRVGIGESSPDVPLHIKSADNVLAKLESTDATVTLDLIDDTSTGRIHQQASELRISSDPSNTVAGSFASFYVDASEAARIDNGLRVLINQTSDIATNSSKLQVFSTGAEAAVNIHRGVASTGAGYLQFQKSRNTTAGSYTIVSDGDSTGNIIWRADDGTAYDSEVAWISAVIDGTPGANDTPGRLVFRTTADGAASATERMRIDQAGSVAIGALGAITSPAGFSKTVLSLAGSTAPSVVLRATTGNEMEWGLSASGGWFGTADNFPMRFVQNNGEAMRIDSSKRVLVGSSGTTLAIGGFNPHVQVTGTTYQSSSYSASVFSNDSNPALFMFSKSRGSTVPDYTIVNDGDNIGNINWNVADGTDLASYIARLSAQVDGTPSANDTPGRLVFYTTADGANAVTERMRIDNEGRVSIGYAGVKSAKLLVMTSDGQVPTNASAARPALNLTSSQTAAVDVGPSIYFRGQTGNTTAEYSFGAIQGVKGSATAADYAGHLVFYAQPSGGATLLEEVMRVRNGGYVVVSSTGEARSMSLGASSARLQIEGTTSGAGRPGVSGTQNSNDASGPVHYLAKSRGTANGSNTIVQDDDYLGQLNWNGADGTQMVQAGNVSLRVDGTPGTNDMPGRLVFMTTSDGANSPTERVRITNGGDVLVGTTTTSGFQSSSSESGTIAYAAGGIASNSPSNDVAGVFNRLGNAGAIVQLKDDGTTVGQLLTGAGGYMHIIGGNNTFGSGIALNNQTWNPTNASGTITDNLVKLGDISSRFTDLYLSGGVYLGGTGSANKLDDYEEGSWTPTVTTGFTSPSYSIQVGYYTKIGNVVRAYYRLLLNGGTATASSVIFSGLPFTASNLGSLFPVGTHYINAATAGGEHSKLLVFPNTNSIYLYSQDEAGVSGIAGTTVGNSLDILGQVIYQTDS